MYYILSDKVVLAFDEAIVNSWPRYTDQSWLTICDVIRRDVPETNSQKQECKQTSL